MTPDTAATLNRLNGAPLHVALMPTTRSGTPWHAPTIGDVADAAGVSKSTVSRALCDAPNVRPETRERVRVAATRLGYVPNDAARALAARRAVVVAQATAVAIRAEMERLAAM